MSGGSDIYVVELNQREGTFHIRSLKECAESNLAVLGMGRTVDCVVVGIAGSMMEANELASDLYRRAMEGKLGGDPVDTGHGDCPAGAKFLEFEVDKPALFFKCDTGVFQKGGGTSVCYTSGRDRAELVKDALNYYFRHKEGLVEELRAKGWAD